jgi:hypothetical protein
MTDYLTDISDQLLTEALTKSFGRDTMRPKGQHKWDPSNPSLDQCCPTALAVNAITGFSIYVCQMIDSAGKIVDDNTHFCNLKPNGEIYDGSADQFNHLDFKPVYERKRKVQPERLLRTKHVKDRFLILEQRVRKALEDL